MYTVDWLDIKKFVDDRNLSIQFIELSDNYYLGAFDGPFSLKSIIPKTNPKNSNQIDFEDNYKNDGNKRLQEKGTLKVVKAKSNTTNGIATVLLKIPGTAGQVTRVINGGIGWFAEPHDDDYVEIYISDEDNILGYGAGAIVGSYTDTEVNSENKGWYFPKSAPVMNIKALAGMGNLVGGLYLKIIAIKGDSNLNDIFRCNLEWGTPV